MELKEQLTNEKIRKKFASQFDLVNYAIKLAENMILTGRAPRVKMDSQNRSLHVITEILNDKDRFDEIKVVETETFSSEQPYHEEKSHKYEKSSERKKSRSLKETARL